MKNNYHPFDEINLIAQIADLKEVNYKNSLVIAALIELLVEKGIAARSEIIDKANELEVDLAINLLKPDTSIFPKDLH